MYSLVLFIHVIISLILIGLILMQRGKGADMGSSFGAGASSTVFGAAGSTSFLVKLTAVFGVLFFVMSLILGAMSTHAFERNSPVATAVQVAEQTAAKAADAPQLPTAPQPTA